MVLKNIHEKLLNGIQTMLVDTRVKLPFYGNFNLYINFHEQDSVGTCGVNMTAKGMNFFYSPKFLEDMSQKEVNFIILHEDFHLLFDHPRRTVSGQYDHKLSNIVQDMIINHIIWEDISHNFVEIPKGKDGKNMALFVPKEYTGRLIFEELYEWMKDEKQKWENQQGGDGQEGEGQEGENQGEGGGSQSGDGGYGKYGKNPKDGEEAMDCWSKEKIFQDLKDGKNGEYLDQHIENGISSEYREALVRDVIDKLQARGFATGNTEGTLDKLRKKRKDYLREIKRAMSNVIFGTNKEHTIAKPNRRGIMGVKGNRKLKTMINVILDTSGSMGGHQTFEKILSYVNRNDISMNLIEGDTEVKWVETIKSQKQLQSIKIAGLGGTALNPSIEYVAEHFNKYNTVILTDGYTDNLDVSKLKGKVLIISIGEECPVAATNGRLKQIVVDLEMD